jgi:hypothetical protein
MNKDVMQSEANAGEAPGLRLDEQGSLILENHDQLPFSRDYVRSYLLKRRRGGQKHF